ncbi:MAG: BBE domain-containing protein, partial [Natronosporangium sp.]
SVVNLRLCPPSPAIPAQVHGTPVVAVVACWSGAPERAPAHLRRLRDLARPVTDSVAAMPYLELQRLADTSVPHGSHYYWRSAYLEELTDGVIEVIVEHAARITSPLSAVPVYHLGGAASRMPAGATAYGPRSASHNLSMFAGWQPADGDPERHVAWAQTFSEALAPHTTGSYLNFLGEEGSGAVRAAYGGRWRRLVALKRRTDPSNIFRYNHNIDPAGEDGSRS